MNVFLSPTGICAGSHAFRRIASALARYAPSYVEIVADCNDADLVILYAVSLDAIEAGRKLFLTDRKWAVVQCCVGPTICPVDWWYELWSGAAVVMSYYQLAAMAPNCQFNFYHAPLGIDDVFKQPQPAQPRNLVITTGYCDGEGAEAISEVWKAVEIVNSLPGQPFALQPLHIGPKHVQGMVNVPSNWHNEEGVTDERLAQLYNRAQWTASLRAVEGFELPAAESLACGARPLLFSQSSLKTWYEDLAVYIDECSGQALVDKLVTSMSEPFPVSSEERQQAIDKFDWKVIVEGFWRRIGL
jgi:hypothetical protein